VAEILRIPVDRELSDRVRWLISLRWITLSTVALIALISNQWMGGQLPTRRLVGSIIAIAIVNATFWLITNRLVSRSAQYECNVWLLHGQILTDLVALTVLLHYSGGLENPFSAYYILLVAIGSILMTARAGYLYAGVASLLWIGLLVAEATGLVPHYNLAGFRSPVRFIEPGHIIAEAFVVSSGCLVVAAMASHVVDRLRIGEEELLDARASCELRAAELGSLNRRLQELDRTRSMFIRLVTHELRAPVAAIQSYLRLILDGYVPGERLNEIISKAERRARDQLELISDLLDLARLTEPSDDQPIKASSAAAVLKDVVDMMQARIDDKGLQFSVSMPDHMPLCDANEEHVRQIWINLISNAIKYTPEGGRVDVRLGAEEGMLVGVVQDSGIGIRPEELEHVFESFYRTEAAKNMARHGTGLGLSIVKGIVNRYGGTICAESVPDKGSTFRFELPVVCDE